MTNQEAVRLMENELRCVQRANANCCDRNCAACDLLEEADDIIKAYGMAIEALKNNYNDFKTNYKNPYTARLRDVAGIVNRTEKDRYVTGAIPVLNNATNGDIINSILNVDKDCISVEGKDGLMTFTVTQEWWERKF